MIFPQEGPVCIQFMDDSRKRYTLALDPGTRSLTLTRPASPWKAKLSYQELDSGHLVLDGTFNGQQIRAKLHPADGDRFLLVRNGFHWVHEPSTDP